MSSRTFAALLLALSSASALPQTAAPSRAPTLQDLEKRLQFLETRLNGLQARVNYRLASLDCNSGKYDEFLLITGNVTFFAACTKIEPYLEGHRVTLSIGNPYAFNFNNIKGKLGYGKNFADALLNEAEVNTPEHLRAGSWNTIVVTVNPSKPEDMRTILLQLSAETASGR